MNSPQETLRCIKCNLVQYRGNQTACRKCHASFILKPIAAAADSLDSIGIAAVIREQPMSFGERIRVIRKRAGLSQRQVAERMGAPRTYLSKIEVRNTSPNLPQVIRLAAALGCSEAEFFPDPGPPPSDSLEGFMRELTQRVGGMTAHQKLEVLFVAKKLARQPKVVNVRSA